MNSQELFEREYDNGNLINIFHDKIKPGSGPGADGISVERFEKEIAFHLYTIGRKINNYSYNFTTYKTLLISKGADKLPRKIAKPTIRDKIVLRALYNILIEIYSEQLGKRTLHKQIGSAIKVYRAHRFDHVLRFDVKDFFPSIDHDILIKTINKKIKNGKILFLIKSLLRTQFSIDKKKGKDIPSIGVAQGLSVSATLANIYLFDFDKKYESKGEICYYRYIDDILIFCNENDSLKIKKNVIKDLKKHKLEIHEDEKNDDIGIGKPFDYLGYYFQDKYISVRRKSFQKIVDSIIEIIATTKGKNRSPISKAMFKLNLRITGCIYNNKRYGWLFFFSQIDNIALLSSLDHVLKIQLKRFKLDEKSVKSFRKSWFQIRYNMDNTNYIPNFDKYTFDEKREIVYMYYKNSILDEFVDGYFSRIVLNETSRLERDMAELS